MKERHKRVISITWIIS